MLCICSCRDEVPVMRSGWGCPAFIFKMIESLPKACLASWLQKCILQICLHIWTHIITAYQIWCKQTVAGLAIYFQHSLLVCVKACVCVCVCLSGFHGEVIRVRGCTLSVCGNPSLSFSLLQRGSDICFRSSRQFDLSNKHSDFHLSNSPRSCAVMETVINLSIKSVARWPRIVTHLAGLWVYLWMISTRTTILHVFIKNMRLWFSCPLAVDVVVWFPVHTNNTGTIKKKKKERKMLFAIFCYF